MSQLTKERGEVIKRLLYDNSKLRDEIEALRLQLSIPGTSDSTVPSDSDSTDEDEEQFHLEQEQTPEP